MAEAGRGRLPQLRRRRVRGDGAAPVAGGDVPRQGQPADADRAGMGGADRRPAGSERQPRRLEPGRLHRPSRRADDGLLSDPNRHSYFVGENTLTYLDDKGNKITGDLEALYVLNKVQDQLVGEKWHLVSFRGDEVQFTEAKAERAYIQFNDDYTITGYTGCNTMQGAYAVDDAQNIKFSKLVNTLQACPEMETENEFLKAINTTAAFGFEDHALVMYDKDHQKLATFKAAN